MASSRYTSYDTRSSASSLFSDPSSSAELSFKSSASRAIVKSKHSDVIRVKSKPSDQNLTAMVKKFMGSKPKTGNHTPLVIPADFIAEDLKKTARKGTNFGGLHKKIFGKGKASSEMKEREAKALTEVKSNTRTLAMVLRSERELLSFNKSQEMEISELKLMLQEKTREVEKLKDLCLNQREEIKSLKDAILFPDVMNSQLQDLVEKQGSELKQAKQVIPTLQKQVTSLTGQLRSLAEDLAEVKADKYGGKTLFQCNGSSTRTPSFDDEDSSKSLDYSSCDPPSPGSPADMFINDFNPCLTPHTANSKSKIQEASPGQTHHQLLKRDGMVQEFEAKSPDYLGGKRLSRNKMEFNFNSYTTTKLSKSSESNNKSNTRNTESGRAARRSDGTKKASGKQTY